MFATMRLALFEERTRHGSMDVLSPRKVLELATIGGARGLRMDRTTGSLTPGKRADLILVRTDSLAVAPVADPVHLIVHSAQPSDVDTVIVDGRILKRGGELLVADTAEVVRRSEGVLARVAGRAGWDAPRLSLATAVT
jgi:cytosine/adenosine deaminase-related metal-dependent hydrolase